MRALVCCTIFTSGVDFGLNRFEIQAGVVKQSWEVCMHNIPKDLRNIKRVLDGR